MALKDIVNINITRQTTSVAVAAFNVPLILSTFATSKTTTAFTRARSYGSVKEMTDDGWASTDAVYKIANAIFSQNPSVSRVVVGRADSGDADVAASMVAIQNEDNSWYGVAVDQAMASNFAAIAAWVESASPSFGPPTRTPTTPPNPPTWLPRSRRFPTTARRSFGTRSPQMARTTRTPRGWAKASPTTPEPAHGRTKHSRASSRTTFPARKPRCRTRTATIIPKLAA